jgi:hypothetical protein
MINVISRIKFNFKKNKFIKKYLNYLEEKTSDYIQFIKDSDEEEVNKIGLWCVEIYDVLDNKGFNKLVKRLFSLKNKTSEYEVDIIYRKRSFFQLQYTRVELDYTSIGLVGRIKFKSNQYIREITITKTQINNNEFILCYSIHFKKLILSYEDLHDYVLDNIKLIKKSKNCTWYVNDDIFEQKDNKQILRLEFEWLRDWLQGIIEQLLYSKYGRFYRIPILYNYNIFEKSEAAISELKTPFLVKCFSDEKNEEFLHIESFNRYEGCHIDRYTFGKSLTESRFLEYFSRYGNEFYYYLFNNIENAEIERRLGRYFTSLKRKVDTKDQKWLINKIRALKERKVSRPYKEDSDIWINYFEGKKTEEKFINYPYYQDKFLEIYEQYFDYIKSINSLSYDLIILWVSGLALIATLIGIWITI